MNGKLLYWLLGALVSVLLIATTIISTLSLREQDEQNRRITRLEEKIDAIQQQYGQISQINSKLDRLDALVIELLRGPFP